MARQGTHLSGIDASEKQPRPGIPRQLQASVALWLVAVAAGLFETALVVVDATDGEVGSAAQLAAGVAVRLLVFTGTVYLATQLRQGRNWARVALAVAGTQPCSALGSAHHLRACAGRIARRLHLGYLLPAQGCWSSRRPSRSPRSHQEDGDDR